MQKTKYIIKKRIKNFKKLLLRNIGGEKEKENMYDLITTNLMGEKPKKNLKVEKYTIYLLLDFCTANVWIHKNW